MGPHLNVQNQTNLLRCELEIVTLFETYLRDGNLCVETLGRGYDWFDIGIHTSLLEASNFLRTLTEHQDLQIGSSDEIAYQNE